MEPERLQHARLLLVDDEDNFRETIAKRMVKRGLSVLQAGNGEDGLSLMAMQPMDVVIMDVKMPGMSGIETLGRIKKAYPDTQVILLTGHSATQDGVSGIKSGAFDYLSKPVELDHLIRKIDQAYEKKRNIEQRKKDLAYKAQIEQQMIATERLAALGTLAAGVAHEINNPLAIINEAAGYLTSLLNKPELAGMPRKADFGKALEKINKGVQRARTITHQLLGSVRKQDPVVAQVNLSELAAETIQLVRNEALDSQIDIVLIPEPNLPIIWVDPNQVRQVLINLLTNAIHATAAQGKVSIYIDKVNDHVHLSIDDTGKGIPKEHMGKIFEPFFSDKPPGKGTGLGLFVTREIIERLKGSIEIQSRVGVGTTVTVKLPIHSNTITANDNAHNEIYEGE